jgi:hypothetical protein
MLNLLFDTFHSIKYFYAHFYTLACYFCVGSSSNPNVMNFLGKARLDDSRLL